MAGKISEDSPATTLVGVQYAGIQDGANVRVPQTLLDAEFMTSAEVAATYLTQADAATDYQPLDADLTAIAALTTTSFGRGLLEKTAAVDVRDTLDTAPYVATSTALKALDTTKDTTAYLTESGREGVFVFRSGDYSAEVTADTAEGIYVKADAIATTSGAWVRQYDGYVNAKWFGVKGDGTAETMTTIEAARDYIKTLGGGRIYFPAGTYLLGEGSTTAVAIQIDDDDIWLVGDGPGATIFKLDDAADSHVINVDGADISGGGLIGIEIDGNRANQTASVHGIRLDGVSDWTCRDYHIHDTVYYGIGGQDGTLSNINILDGIIENTGADLVDFKNKDDDNAASRVRNLTGRSWGLNGSLTIQAGVDIRGPVDVSGVILSSPPSDGVGVRFRPGELLDSNGLGGHNASLSSFDIRMGAAATGVGVDVLARDVAIADGYISGGLRGVVLSEQRAKVTLVTVEGTSNEAFYANETGGFEGDGAIITSCTARNNTDRGFRIGADGVQLIGCTSVGNDDGIIIDAAANATRVIGGRVAGNTTTSLADSGSNSLITGVDGYKTSVNLESALLACDSTGSKTDVIAHGLPFTPNKKDCTLTVLRETAVADHVIGLLQVDSISSTEIVVRGRVTTASATVGATFRIGCKIEGKVG